MVVLLISFVWGPQVAEPKKIVNDSSFFQFVNFVFCNIGLLLSLALAGLVRVFSCALLLSSSFATKYEFIFMVTAAAVYWGGVYYGIEFIADKTGDCLIAEAAQIYNRRRTCMDAGGVWTGFDISGHTFLIALSIGLFYDQAEFAVKTLKSRCAQILPSRSDSEHQVNIVQLHEKISPARRIMLLASLALMCTIWIAWSLLLMHTSYHFHTPWEKLVGVVIGFGFWWPCYLIRSKRTK